MEFRCLPLVFSLNLLLMTVHAAIPPEVYWERMLPNTPMPKAIIDFLNLDQLPLGYGAKKTQSEDDQPLWYGVKKTQSEDQPLWYGVKKTQSEDQPLWYGVKKTQSEKQPLWYGVKKTYVAKRSLSQEDETILVANGHQHDIPKADQVFFEEGLRPGTKLDAHFKKRENVTPLLPRQIAQHIPLSSAKIKEIVEMLFVNPEPENVKILEETISMCEVPAITGEERYCATSLESMVDFVTSKLGKNARVISTEAEKESKSQKFSVKDGVKLLAEDKVIVCHPMDYPYVVFMCHEISNTTAHFMPLEGEDGTRVKAAAVCHKDTSEWDPNHVFLQMLKTKPGAAPVCHIFPEGHLLWFAK
ncbi:Dehydration-responsive protein RD22 [Glycine soja]|uniref:Dehydration-responsive protein RD22 n=1 Tax=Glycine soja TaxID=3848 RepID=A0A0B2PRJ8_GLYSO|nr:Dehydration-responsive protein RD22 [Glycine soja]